MLSQQINESIAEISVRRLAIIIHLFLVKLCRCCWIPLHSASCYVLRQNNILGGRGVRILYELHSIACGVKA